MFGAFHVPVSSSNDPFCRERCLRRTRTDSVVLRELRLPRPARTYRDHSLSVVPALSPSPSLGLSFKRSVLLPPMRRRATLSLESSVLVARVGRSSSDRLACTVFFLRSRWFPRSIVYRSFFLPSSLSALLFPRVARSLSGSVERLCSVPLPLSLSPSRCSRHARFFLLFAIVTRSLSLSVAPLDSIASVHR